MILVNDLPDDDDGARFYGGAYWGARAITSPSGDGVILQGSQYLYQLTCDDENCIWQKLQTAVLSNKLNWSIMTYLPGKWQSQLTGIFLPDNLCQNIFVCEDKNKT